MDTNAKKLEIIQHITQIRDTELINQIERYIRDLHDDDRYYKRERFYDDGTYKDKKKEKPSLINEARRKIKAKLGFVK